MLIEMDSDELEKRDQERFELVTQVARLTAENALLTRSVVSSRQDVKDNVEIARLTAEIERLRIERDALADALKAQVRLTDAATSGAQKLIRELKAERDAAVAECERLRGAWMKRDEHPELFSDGEVLLVAVPVCRTERGVSACVKNRADWYYEYSVIRFAVDEDYFSVRTMDDEPWGWDWSDVEYWTSTKHFAAILAAKEGDA